MNPEEKKLIAEATKSLKLVDIILYESRFSRPSDMPDEVEKLSSLVKRGASYSIDSVDEAEVLSVKTEFGVRLTDVESNPEEADVFIEIEADYIVQYELLNTLSDECLSAFSEFNGVHNTWPFWRQHVLDLVQRGHLPPIVIPLFSGDE